MQQLKQAAMKRNFKSLLIRRRPTVESTNRDRLGGYNYQCRPQLDWFVVPPLGSARATAAKLA